MKARLEHRLTLTMAIEESADRALVPQLMLQPLVENAICHGMDPVTFRVEIRIQARREGNQLHLTIRDHGPGLASEVTRSAGIGLNNTTRRLRTLYGDDQGFRIQDAEGGGVAVDIYLPYREQINEHSVSERTPITEDALT